MIDFWKGDLRLLGQTLVEIRRRAGALVLLGIMSRLVATSLVGPTAAGVITSLVAWKGSYSVGNTDIVAFLLTPVGFLVVLASGTLGFLAQTTEFAALLILGSDPAPHQGEPALRAVWRTFRALPRLLILALWQWAALLLIALPFLVVIAVAYRWLWAGLDLNYLVESRPPAFWGMAAIVAGAAMGYAMVAAPLLLRWLLAVPVLLFERVSSLAALKRSGVLARGRRWRMARLVVVWLVANLGANAVLLAVLRGASREILTRSGTSLAVAIPVCAVLLGLHAVAIAALGFVVNAVGALLLLNLYNAPKAVSEPLEARLQRRSRPWGRLLVLAGLAAALGVAMLASVGVVASLEVRDDVAITGHRGDPHDAPENTLAAFRAAIAAGADFGELDVQLSRDGVVMVVHDEDFRRLVGIKSKVRDLTLAEIQRIDLGSAFAPQFRGEHAPTLAEVIDVAGDRLRLMIEIKVYPGDDTPKLVRETVELLARKQFGKRCLITSLSYAALQEVRRIAPDLAIAYLVSESVGDLTRLDVDVLSVRSGLARPGLIAEAHHRGKPVHAWTVDSPDLMVKLWSRGVVNVIGNDPRSLIARRAEVRNLSDAERLLLQAEILLSD